MISFFIFVNAVKFNIDFLFSIEKYIYI